MIVDIQGVGNLWTDPQIHSLAGDDYGDGNLGVGGMALFFSTSRYGPVARALGLPLFALSPAEQARIDAHQAQLAASDPASAEGAPYVAPTQVSEPGGRSSRSSRTSNPAATLHMLCEAAAAGDAAAVRDLVLLDEVDANTLALTLALAPALALTPSLTPARWTRMAVGRSSAPPSTSRRRR